VKDSSIQTTVTSGTPPPHSPHAMKLVNYISQACHGKGQQPEWDKKEKKRKKKEKGMHPSKQYTQTTYCM
jgi:hypothetical protein